MLRRLAAALAGSPLLARARRLTEKNRADWNLPLSRTDNLLICSYLMLSDYAAGLLPPAHSDKATAYENEMQYGYALGGISKEEFQAREVRKPFWDANAADKYLNGFVRLLRLVESLGLADEPNVLHTFTSYRMGKLSQTREIGMSRRRIIRCLRGAGYREVRTISPRIDDRLHPHWIVARK